MNAVDEAEMLRYFSDSIWATNDGKAELESRLFVVRWSVRECCKYASLLLS